MRTVQDNLDFNGKLINIILTTIANMFKKQITVNTYKISEL